MVFLFNFILLECGTHTHREKCLEDAAHREGYSMSIHHITAACRESRMEAGVSRGRAGPGRGGRWWG